MENHIYQGMSQRSFILESPNEPINFSVQNFQLKGYEDGASFAGLEFRLRAEEK